MQFGTIRFEVVHLTFGARTPDVRE